MGEAPLRDPDKPSTIVLNGFWAKIAQAVLIAAVLAGAGGLLIAIQMNSSVAAQGTTIDDHEERIRADRKSVV